MKKIMMALLVLMFFAGSGWAADDDAMPPTDAIASETSVELPDMNNSESSAAIPDVEDSDASAAPQEQPPAEAAVEAPEEESHGVGHAVLLYIPNRILDVFDFARLRVRAGPGAAFGVRATRLLALSFGGYTSIYAGLPGPRLKPTVKWPVGIENYAGLELSVVDASAQGGFGPDYSNTEFEVSLHALLIGLDIGVDPVEILDLALGFLFIDIRGDDL